MYHRGLSPAPCKQSRTALIAGKWFYRSDRTHETTHSFTGQLQDGNGLSDGKSIQSVDDPLRVSRRARGKSLLVRATFPPLRTLRIFGREQSLTRELVILQSCGFVHRAKRTGRGIRTPNRKTLDRGNDAPAGAGCQAICSFLASPG